MEIWKPANGYEGYYEVSSMGRVRSVDRTTPHPRNKTMVLARKGRILKYEFDKYGYPVVTLSKDSKTKTFKIHRLVAMAFVDNPNNLSEIDHINAKKYDNRPENLRWCTTQQNSEWRTQKLRPKVKCKETGGVFTSSYDAAAWVIQKGLKTKKGIQTTNYKTVARCIRDACHNRIRTAYKFHWTYLEGSTTIPKGSREKSRNDEPRVRRVKI
jgi:hypothetical protein